MKIFKRTIAGLSAVCLLSMLFSSCLKDNSNYYNPPVALVSFIQASPDEPPLLLYFNSNQVNWSAVNYGGDIDYFRAYTGTRTVNLYNFATMGKILSDTIQLNQNTSYTIFMANTSAKPEIFLLTDSISKPPAGDATVRFVNASPDAPAVDLAIKSGSTLVSNKSYKGSSSFVPVAANTGYTLQVLQHGTSTVLATLTDITLTSGYVYTVWLQGLAGATTTTDQLSANIVANAYYY